MGYADPMRFEPGELALLDATEEIEIETARPGGPAHRTIIWVVVDGDDAFVRRSTGATARWYREAVANPAVAIHVDGRRAGRPRAVAADRSRHRSSRVSDALRRKYTGDGGLRDDARARPSSTRPSGSSPPERRRHRSPSGARPHVLRRVQAPAPRHRPGGDRRLARRRSTRSSSRRARPAPGSSSTSCSSAPASSRSGCRR